MENQKTRLAQGPKMMPIEELFKKSFSLYYQKAFFMIRLILAGWIGGIIIVLVFGAIALALVFWKMVALGIVAILVGALLLIIISLWLQVALVFSIKEPNGQIDIKTLLFSVKDKIVPYFWVTFLKGLMVLGGFILLIIPGIIFSVWFCLVEYAFVFEGKKGFSASWRSKELVKGYGWAVLGRLLAFMFLAMIISFIPRVGEIINMLFVMPFGIFYMYCIYEDLKRIKG